MASKELALLTMLNSMIDGPYYDGPKLRFKEPKEPKPDEGRFVVKTSLGYVAESGYTKYKTEALVFTSFTEAKKVEGKVVRITK